MEDMQVIVIYEYMNDQRKVSNIQITNYVKNLILLFPF